MSLLAVSVPDMTVQLPDIRTERLVLRRLRSGDEAAAVEIHTDPETNRYYPWARDAAGSKAWLDEAIRRWDEHGFGYWAIEEHASGELIGFGGISRVIDDGEEVLNLYYRFRPSAWGKGYAVEMARHTLAWAEANVPHTPVSIVTRPENTPSLRVAEKLGFALLRERVKDGVREVVLRKP